MKDWAKNIKIEHFIAVLAIVLCFAYLFFVTAKDFNTAKETMIYGIVTGVISVLTGIFGYFFGASKSGDKKDEAVSKLIDHNKTITDEKNSNTGGS